MGPLFSIASIAMFRPRTAGFHLVSGGSRPLDNGGGGGGAVIQTLRQGGARSQKNFFRPLGPLVWSKKKAFPGSATAGVGIALPSETY